MREAGVWLQPGEYYACTEEERKHQFSYLETLQKARSSGFLQATQCYISPIPRDFEEVVTSAGGQATAPAERLYVVADLKTKEAQDLRLWASLSWSGCVGVSFDRSWYRRK